VRVTRARGFSIVEMMVAIAIFAFLAALATPSVTTFLANTRIRNAADALASGIRLTRVEAVKRNRPIEFVLGTAGYTVRDPGPPTSAIDAVTVFDRAGYAATPSPAGATTVRYTALGQYDATVPDSIDHIDVTASIGSAHPLRVVVQNLSNPAQGVGVRVCDTRFPASDPVGCPP
jgi:type IV fimbrial biogenesis protein FimT